MNPANLDSGSGPKDFRVVVLISGRGSNFKCLLEKASNFKILALISNKADAPGIRYAKEAKVPHFSFPRSDFQSVDSQKEALFAKIRGLNPDLICLAGYMQIVRPDHAREFFGKLINIHPSLLPQFPGLDTHQQALAAKATRHGCSVHLVDAGVDSGPIIAQAGLQVFENESAESLQNRVLELEHKLYPWVVAQISSGGIKILEGKIEVSPETRTHAKFLEIDFLAEK